MIEQQKEVNILQACAIVGVCRRTIYNWIQTGKLRYRRTAGGSIRIETASLYREDGKTHGGRVALRA